jgi:hypothetical protein
MVQTIVTELRRHWQHVLVGSAIGAVSAIGLMLDPHLTAAAFGGAIVAKLAEGAVS